MGFLADAVYRIIGFYAEINESKNKWNIYVCIIYVCIYSIYSIFYGKYKIYISNVCTYILYISHIFMYICVCMYICVYIFHIYVCEIYISYTMHIHTYIHSCIFLYIIYTHKHEIYIYIFHLLYVCQALLDTLIMTCQNNHLWTYKDKYNCHEDQTVILL